MKFSIAVVLYNPSEENLMCIAGYCTIFDKTYIFDNSDQPHNYLFQKSTIEYNYFGENTGLGIPYNLAIDKSLNDKCDFLCIMDQDSSFSLESIQNLMNAIIEDQNNRSTGIYCPIISVKNGIEKRCFRNDHDFVDWTINSGSFLNLQLIVSHHIRYDENYFLDRIDRDFCQQITKAGILIKKINNAVLIQELGEIYKGKIIHSPIRNYYVARNRLYYNWKFYPVHLRIILDFTQTIRHIIRIVFTGKEVGKNLAMILHGVNDFCHGKFGKLQQ